MTMLIYLDNAHFDYLERPKNAHSTERLLAVWREAGCELALSYLHLREIYQLGSKESIQRRLAVLQNFPLVRFSLFHSLEVTLHEIEEMLKAGIEGRPPDFGRIRHKVFPRVSADEFELACRSLEEPDAGKLRKLEEQRAAWFNEARPQMEHTNKLLAIIRDRPFPDEIDPALRPSPEDLRKAMEGAEDPLLAMFEALYRNVPRDRSGSARRRRDERIIAKHPFFERFRILDSIPRAKTFWEDDMSYTAAFYHMAHSLGEATPGLEGERVLTLSRMIRELDPYDAPGYRLAMAVNRARQRSAEEMMPGCFVDMQHVMAMPYVDLAFVDKRTLGFLRTETKRDKRPLRPDEVSHICRTISLDSLRVEIETRMKQGEKGPYAP